MSDPFKLSVVTKTNGIGLNPELMNIWNLIHPLIIFVGYAMCLIPMVIGIVRISILENSEVPIFEGKERLDRLFEFMVSLAWLILSSGIIIGGYWAYTTLGWGGFWAWDPIETASLVPWLFLTLYFHGKAFYRKNEYLGNYIISMSYIGVLFATYLTRSGILSSVHAYRPDTTLGSILDMLIPQNTFLMSIVLRIIPNDKILLLFIVILVLFLIPHILGIKKGEIKQIRLMLDKTDFQEAKSSNTALKLSFLATFIGIIFIILVLIFPVIYDIIGYIVTLSPDGFDTRIAIGESHYNTVITIFGGIMLIAQFFCTYYPRISIKRKYGIIIGGVTTGLLLTVSGILYRNGLLTSLLGQGNPILSFLSNFWTTSDKANLVLPLILLGIIGLVVEFIKIALTEERHLIRKASHIMLHLSFLVILFGALLSSNMKTTHNLDFVQLGKYEVPGTSITIEILDLNRTFSESGMHSVEYKTSFKIIEGSRVIGSGISRLAYDQSNRQDVTVTIISDLITDFYIVTIATYEDSMSDDFVASSLQIKIIPYINILWIGCYFLHFAMIPLTLNKFNHVRKVFT
jgi:cytochrome c biogenesis factor